MNIPASCDSKMKILFIRRFKLETNTLKSFVSVKDGGRGAAIVHLHQKQRPKNADVVSLGSDRRTMLIG